MLMLEMLDSTISYLKLSGQTARLLAQLGWSAIDIGLWPSPGAVRRSSPGGA